jgi:hypothetical protein
MNRIMVIYSLVDPRDGNVFYVGRTSVKLSHRLQNHLTDARKKTSPKSLRIAEIFRAGKRPTIHEIVRLDNPTKVEAESTEQAWIDFYNLTHKLTNVSTSSCGGWEGGDIVKITPELIASLGKESDCSIARRLNCSGSTISYHRTNLGIPPAPNTSNVGVEPTNKKHLSDSIIQQLGKVPDKYLAKEAGVHEVKIRRERAKRAIPVCPRHTLRGNLPSSIVEKLGKVKDIALAKEAGVSIDIIKGLRYSLGIPSWRATEGEKAKAQKLANKFKQCPSCGRETKGRGKGNHCQPCGVRVGARHKGVKQVTKV